MTKIYTIATKIMCLILLSIPDYSQSKNTDSSILFKLMIGKEIRFFNAECREVLPLGKLIPVKNIEYSNVLIVRDSNWRYSIFNTNYTQNIDVNFKSYLINSKYRYITLQSDSLKYTCFIDHNVGFYHNYDEILPNQFTYVARKDSSTIICNYNHQLLYNLTALSGSNCCDYKSNAIIAFSIDSIGNSQKYFIQDKYTFKDELMKLLNSGFDKIVLVSDSALLVDKDNDLYVFSFLYNGVRFNNTKYFTSLNDSMVILNQNSKIIIYNLINTKRLNTHISTKRFIVPTQDVDYLLFKSKRRMIQTDVMAGHKIQDFKKNEKYLYSINGTIINRWRNQLLIHTEDKIVTMVNTDIYSIDFINGLVYFDTSKELLVFNTYRKEFTCSFPGLFH